MIWAESDLATAQLDPNNRKGTPGENLLSRNFNWSLSLLSLPGRAGLDLGLGISYNTLNSITQTWSGQTHTWATFAYGTQTIQTNFAAGLTMSGASNGSVISVLKRVGLDDGSTYSFEYTTYCQIKTIRRYAPNTSNPVTFPNDYFQRAYTTYNLPDNTGPTQSDCPRFTTRTDWAYEWNGGVTFTYGPTTPTWAYGEVTTPDGTLHKEFFATSGWQRGLTTQSETWSGGARKKWTTLCASLVALRRSRGSYLSDGHRCSGSQEVIRIC